MFSLGLKTFWIILILFLEMLSYERIVDGSLDSVFIPSMGFDRVFDTPLSHITNEDALYGRNIISSLLHPYIETFFGDISSQNSDKIFEYCYVSDQSLLQMDENLKAIIIDEIPQYAEKDGFQELLQQKTVVNLAKDIRGASTKKSIGNSILLMWVGLGCGKSTYLRRLMRLLSNEQAENKILIIYIDYLGYSPKLRKVSDFTYALIAEELRRQKSILQEAFLKLFSPRRNSRIETNQIIFNHR